MNPLLDVGCQYSKFNRILYTKRITCDSQDQVFIGMQSQIFSLTPSKETKLSDTIRPYIYTVLTLIR